MLGSPHASLSDGQDARFTVDNSLLLLAYLALEPNKIHRRMELASMLYPDNSENQSNVNLRQVFLRLRRTLGDEAVQRSYFIGTQLTLQFNPASDYWLDINEFNSLISAVEQHRHRRLEVCKNCIARLDQAANLYQGEFLSGVTLHQNLPFGEWLDTTRADLHRKARWALINLTHYSLQHQQYDKCHNYVNRLSQMDTFNEEALRLELKLLAYEGQRNQALLRYHEFQIKLYTELSVTPETESILLSQNIRNGLLTGATKNHRPGKETLVTFQEFSANSKPSSLIPFIGRQAEMEQITRFLTDRDTRIITLVGTGGIGKTRLAMRAASEDAASWESGAWLVLLGECSSDQGFEETLMKAIGIKFDATQTRRSLIFKFLRDKEILLVLDNLDRLNSLASLIKSILDNAPRLKLLLTSRQRLGIRGEQVIDVRGLDYPHPDNPQPFDNANLINLAENFSAVQLFATCAKKIRPEFNISHGNLDSIVKICKFVDGLPLGIELAASWVRILSCEEIFVHLQNDLDFLTSQNKDVPFRHKSMRSVFDDSWRLLAPDEQLLLNQLSIYQDGFSADTVNDIGHNLQTLAGLSDKSLLVELPSNKYIIRPYLIGYAAEKYQLQLSQVAVGVD